VVVQILELGLQGALPSALILGVALMTVAATALVVLVEGAQRRLLVQHPTRQVGDSTIEGQSSHLLLKLNTAGVRAPIIAESLVLLPTTILAFSAGQLPEWFGDIAAQFGPGRPLHLVLHVALIVFFTFFYTATAFDPAATAENLRKHGDVIPGVRPGEPTADYIDHVLSCITVIGAAYLAVLCVLPELLLPPYLLRFVFSGSSLLIVVVGTVNILESTKKVWRPAFDEVDAS
jgi:preprotein translocase subunit SecY